MEPAPLRERLLCDRMHSGCNGCCSKEATAVKERREPTINKSPSTRLHSEAKLSRGRATKSKLEKTDDLSLHRTALRPCSTAFIFLAADGTEHNDTSQKPDGTGTIFQ